MENLDDNSEDIRLHSKPIRGSRISLKSHFTTTTLTEELSKLK